MAIDTKYIGLADKFAVSASTVCAFHCIALPFLVGVFPVIGTSFFGDEAFHVWLLWAVIPLSAFGLFLGCKRHKEYSVLRTGMVGVAVLVLAAIFGHDVLDGNGERAATLLGATIIAWAHFRNYRSCRRADCSH